MVDAFKKNSTEQTLFFGFLLFHLTLWTLAPTWLRNNLPLDAMEGTTWGSHLDWGYDKNPFMTAWLSQLAIVIGGASGWMTYLFSQCCVGVAFLAVWRLARNILPPSHALVSVLLLEGIQYYHLHAIDFSDNTLELALWALIALFFYRAIKDNRWFDWAATGLFAGLGLMTKYYTVLLLLSMLLFLCFSRDQHKHVKNPFLYLGLTILILVCLPHCLWLISHDFITVSYAIQRTNLETSSWLDHVIFPLRFSLDQLTALLPALLLSLFFYQRKTNTALTLKKRDERLIIFLGVIPFLLTISISLFTGATLRAAWGQPLLFLSGILILLWLNPVITKKRLGLFMATLAGLMCITVMMYCLTLAYPRKADSAHFPGKNIAMELTKQWHQRYHTPLRYVAGGRWLAGNIHLYSSDNPSVYIDWNQPVSPWIDEAKLRRDGAIFVWDLSTINRRQEIAASEIKQRFPQMTEPQLLRFPWTGNSKASDLLIMMAYLPPSKATG